MTRPADRDATDSGPGSDGIGARFARSLAGVGTLPTSVRALLDYYATSGDLALGAIGLQRRVETFVEGVVDGAFADVERAIAGAADVDPNGVSFAYDTKLTMPAELTLGHLYQRADVSADNTGSDGSGPQPTDIDRAETVTELVVVALLDGDMRDAINDAEYEDFRIEGAPGIERARAAELAQRALRERVDVLFDGHPDGVREAYCEAVDRSETHQDRDPYFRELMAAAEDGDPDATAAIREEYKHGALKEPTDCDAVIRPTELFVNDEHSFPYLATQYGRVGVIYDGMIEMYRAAGIPIEDPFKRSIVFTIIGAQIWLDDIDDYEADLAETQLTPVTAEYLLADSDREAYRAVVAATETYLDAAERYAAATDSPLAGIGTNYVFRSGDPSVLPGNESD